MHAKPLKHVRRALQLPLKSLNLQDNDLFTPELQDRLARELVRSKGLEDYKGKRISAEQFQNNLAGTWASIPVYGTGLNRKKKVRATDDQVQAVIGPLAPH